MTILGLDAGTFAVVAGLITVCGGAMGRLLWLLDGRPPLDRPSWWPRAADTAPAPADAAPAPPRNRLATVAACALCCGAPALLVAGVAVGVASAVSLAGGALVLALVLAWAVLTGRVGPRRRMLTPSTPRASGRRSCCAVDAES